MLCLLVPTGTSRNDFRVFYSRPIICHEVHSQNREISRRQPECGVLQNFNESMDSQTPDAPVVTEGKGFFCIKGMC